MKLLSQAVTDIINTKFSNKSFSAYDITQAIRSDVNDKKYTITTEFSVSPMKLGDVVTQNIPHSTVKRAVESLYTIGQLTRQVVSHDNYNGRAWYEYTLVPSFVDVTTYPKYTELVDIIEDATGIDKKDITPYTNFSKFLDDLDRVEFIMNLEYVLDVDISDDTAVKFCNSDKLTPFMVVNEIIGYNTVTSTTSTSTTSAVTGVTLESLLKSYITKAHSKKYNPTLRNAQKAMSKKVPGITVSIISDTAKALGFSVLGNRSMQFNEYTIGNSNR